jgi:hypothetical protein
VGLHKFFHFVPTMASSPVDRTDYSNYSELAATEFSDDEEQPTMRAPTPEVCPPPALPHPPRIRALCVSRDPSARAPLPKPLARRPAKLRPPPPPAASLHLHPSSLSLTSPSFFPSFSLQPAVDSIDLTGEDILFTQNIPREAPQRSPTRDQSVPDDNDRAPEVEVGQLYSDRAAVMRGIADFAHRTNKEFVCDPLVRGGSGFKMSAPKSTPPSRRVVTPGC